MVEPVQSPWFRAALTGAALSCVLLLAEGPLQTSRVVRVAGTGAASGGLQALAKAYEQQHPDESILILPSIGSSGGIRAALDGKVDLGCTSRPLRPEEESPGLHTVPLANTAFVFATHLATATESLSLADVEDIYAGRRTHWKDGRPIRLILRPKSDTAHAYLSGFTPGMQAALEQAHALPGVRIGITDQEALDQLERTPGSFGTAALGLVKSEERQVQALTVGGIPPTDPAYPFFLTLSLVYKPETCSPATRSFVAFALSKEGRQILLKAGYRPLALAPPKAKR